MFLANHIKGFLNQPYLKKKMMIFCMGSLKLDASQEWVDGTNYSLHADANSRKRIQEKLIL